MIAIGGEIGALCFAGLSSAGVQWPSCPQTPHIQPSGFFPQNIHLCASLNQTIHLCVFKCILQRMSFSQLQQKICFFEFSNSARKLVGMRGPENGLGDFFCK